MRKTGKTAIRLMSFVLVLSMLFVSCGSTEAEETTEEKEIIEVGSAASEEEAVLPADTGDHDKTETVYVTADAGGNAEKTEVTVVLTPNEDGSPIQDVCDLTDIRNSGGDEELTQDGTNLEWENLGEKITYKGESDKDTPVLVDVTYYLDGEKIEPDKLAGQSGRVTIRFDYTNTTSRKIEVDGTKYKTVTPYAAVTAVLLPEDHFSNVEVENGSVMSMDGQRAAIGIAVPGLSDALKLDEFEDLEDVDLPEYVEISADCVDFELDFTATVLTSGLFEDLSDQDLDDVEELTDDLEELADAGDELTDGVLSVLNGSNTISGYFKQYMSGVNAFGDGVLEAGEGISALAEQQTTLAEAAAGLDSGLSAVESSLSGLDLSDAGELSDQGTQLSSDADALRTAIAALETDIQQISEFAEDAAAYEAAVTAAVSSADSSLSAIDLSGLNNKAKEQASAAVSAVLSELGLSEEQLSSAQKQAVINAASSGIDLSSDVSAAQSGISSARSALASIPDLTIPDLTLDLSSVNSAVEALEFDIEALDENGQSIEKIQAAADALQQSLPALTQVAAGVDQGSAAIADYLNQAADGLSGMDSAVTALKTAGLGLAEGLDEMSSGLSEMYDGVEEFNEEGLQELGDLGGTDLEKLINRIRALRMADDETSAFTGSLDGATVQTSYIIETAEIKDE